MSLSSIIDQEIQRRGLKVNSQPKEPWEEFARKTLIRSGRKLIAFDPYEFQIKFVEQIQRHYGTVAVKTRQLGFTETIVSLFLYWAKDDPAFLGVVFSKNQDDTTNIARRCRIMVASHPDLELETSNLKDLKLRDGGRLVFKPSTPNSARSLESVSAILFDEAAFVVGIDEIFSASLPATEMLGSDPIDGAKIIILSTPNGRQSFYWNRVNEHNPKDILRACDDVREGKVEPVQHWTDKEGWCKFIAHWKAHPVYAKRPNYLEEQRKSKRMTEAQVQREFNLSFDASSSRVFPDSLLDGAIVGAWHPKGMFARRYIAGIDPSFGGDDFFVLRIWDITSHPYRLAAQYRDKYRTKDFFIEKAIGLLQAFNPLMVNVETNGGGQLYLQDLTSKCPRLMFQGVTTTRESKLLHTDRLVLFLERNQLLFPPEPEGMEHDEPDNRNLMGASEYAHFIEMAVGASRTRQAETGFHDDTVMADAVAFAFIDEVPPVRSYKSSASSGSREVTSSVGVI